MPSKKRSKEKEVREENREIEEEGEHFLEEDDEEEEIDYFLAVDAEQKVEEALEILGAPAIIHSGVEQYDPYPTDSHKARQVRYTPGDVAPPHNEFLILRK